MPEFERMLVRSGIMLIKYWFSITDDEQHLRFLMRIHDPLKQWKLSPMDLESRRRWEDYTKAKEVMLERTHIPEAPLVGRRGRRQEAGAAQLHPPPARRRSPTRRCCAIPSCCPRACTTRTTCALRCRRKCMCHQSISGRSASGSPVPQKSARVIQFGTRKKFCEPWNRGLSGGFSPHGHAPRPSPPPKPHEARVFREGTCLRQEMGAFYFLRVPPSHSTLAL